MPDLGVLSASHQVHQTKDMSEYIFIKIFLNDSKHRYLHKQEALRGDVWL